MMTPVKEITGCLTPQVKMYLLVAVPGNCGDVLQAHVSQNTKSE